MASAEERSAFIDERVANRHLVANSPNRWEPVQSTDYPLRADVERRISLKKKKQHGGTVCTCVGELLAACRRCALEHGHAWEGSAAWALCIKLRRHAQPDEDSEDRVYFL